MKMRRWILGAAAAAVAALAIACGSESEPPPPPPALAAPANVDVTDGIVTWDEVANAVGYRVFAGDVLAGTTIDGAYTSLDLRDSNAPSGLQGITVVAVAGPGWSDSARSYPPVEFTVPARINAPANVAVTAATGMATWDTVAEADGYHVYAGGVRISGATAITSTLQFDLLDGIIWPPSPPTVQIQVRAMSDDPLAWNSDLSDSAAFTVPVLNVVPRAAGGPGSMQAAVGGTLYFTVTGSGIPLDGTGISFANVYPATFTIGGAFDVAGGALTGELTLTHADGAGLAAGTSDFTLTVGNAPRLVAREFPVTVAAAPLWARLPGAPESLEGVRAAAPDTGPGSVVFDMQAGDFNAAAHFTAGALAGSTVSPFTVTGDQSIVVAHGFTHHDGIAMRILPANLSGVSMGYRLLARGRLAPANDASTGAIAVQQTGGGAATQVNPSNNHLESPIEIDRALSAADIAEGLVIRLNLWAWNGSGSNPTMAEMAFIFSIDDMIIVEGEDVCSTCNSYPCECGPCGNFPCDCVNVILFNMADSSHGVQTATVGESIGTAIPGIAATGATATVLSGTYNGVTRNFLRVTGRTVNHNGFNINAPLGGWGSNTQIRITGRTGANWPTSNIRLMINDSWAPPSPIEGPLVGPSAAFTIVHDLAFGDTQVRVMTNPFAAGQEDFYIYSIIIGLGLTAEAGGTVATIENFWPEATQDGDDTDAAEGLTQHSLVRQEGGNWLLNHWLSQSGTVPVVTESAVSFPGNADHNGLVLQIAESHGDFGNLAGGDRVVVRGTAAPAQTIIIVNPTFATRAQGTADPDGNFEIVWNIASDWVVENVTIRNNHGVTIPPDMPFTITGMWRGTPPAN